jgi:IS605 OrfB family transposase
MPKQTKTPVTQRAYTLRLRGADPNDQSWRNALWQTHEAVNKGAKVFGDWLLTLRGGLDHTLADDAPSDEAQKRRRILLALSWLSVESKLGAPEAFIIPCGKEDANNRNKVIEALEEILKSRSVAQDEINQWKEECKASLCAAIREDAVWVNRSKAFDKAVEQAGCSLTREEVWDMLERYFGGRESYLFPAKGADEESSATDQEDKAKDLVQKAGQWLSSRFGTGEGADFSRMARVYQKISSWAAQAQAGTTGNEAINNLAAALSEFSPASNDLNGVLRLISGPGYKSATRNLLNQLATKTTVYQEDLKRLKEAVDADRVKCQENIGSKGCKPYADVILNHVESACGFTYRTDEEGKDVSVLSYSQYSEDYNWGPARHSEFAVMLDHAARRVSLAHTWIKLAEAERRNFEGNAKKIGDVPKEAREWLDQFCSERSKMSGALEPCRIRRRAVYGWKEVVAAWNKPDCRTAEDRIAAARALQDDPESDKFGDIQLFEALAEDNAKCVWQKDSDNGKAPDSQPLLDYAIAAEADFKKRQFKVPAYRHPDALLHPVFCDFGESRWKIGFSIHEAKSKLETARIKVEKKKEEVAKEKLKFDRAAGQKRIEAEAKLEKTKQDLEIAENELLRLTAMHCMTMTLWNGEKVRPMQLCWQSKKLERDFALKQEKWNDKSVNEVTRADRLGRAAANVTDNDTVTISGLFEQKHWNGRLQAPRWQLETIARHVEKHGWDEKAKKMRARLQWLVAFSAKLQPQEPRCKFAANNQLRTSRQYLLHAEENKKRKGQARLILSRLPGLRVLSVDLGHRYAAACAVWEALSAEDFKKDIKDKRILRGGADPDSLYCLAEGKTAESKKQVTVYRRIGGDTLPDDGKLHPAPWARLDRQFLIKLQGEEESAREASNEEIWAVHQMEISCGRCVPLIDRLIASGWGATEKQKARINALQTLGYKMAGRAEAEEDAASEEEEKSFRPSLSVDELMSSAVRTLRLALKRHGDRARIAHYLMADEKPRPGGIKEKLDETGRIDLLQDALVMWHDLFSSRNWRDDEARNLWDEYVTKLSGYEVPGEISEESSGADRRNKQKENREKLHGAAKALAENATLRETLHAAWKKRWEEDDARWKKQLRWFKDWILPRGTSADDPAIRRVGGLSLTRIATLAEFRRKVQVGFFTRLHPDGTRAETKERFGQSVLDALDHLREQRVKQLASRIAEAALGIGSEAPKHRDMSKRPRRRISDPRFAPCHAVVIEDLTHYRPEETRTRRENRQLMTWASSKVKKYLAEACQLHGSHLREVSAGYTSRQDSRTGAPGIRCQDVPVREFMQSPFWRKQVNQAEKKQAKGDAREIFLSNLNAKWKNKSEAEWEKAGAVRVPLKGGEIFVSSDPLSPAAKGLHADLNAAANIGLRALTDPDWPGKWWYVPCESGSLMPVKDKVEGSAAVKTHKPLCKTIQVQSGAAKDKKRGEKGTGKSKEVINLWRDISSSRLEDGEWKEYASYQSNVQSRVISILEEQIKRCGSHASIGPGELVDCSEKDITDS